MAVGFEPLLALAGVDQVSVADDDGRALPVRGGDPGPAALVLGWGRGVRALSRARERELEDLMITSASAYHLLRRVPVDGAGPAWVYVRVARDEGNLALARRRLAALALHVPEHEPPEHEPEPVPQVGAPESAQVRAPERPPEPVEPASARAVERAPEPAVAPVTELPAGAVPLPRRRPGALLPTEVRRAGSPGPPAGRAVGLFEPATPATPPKPITPPAPTVPATPTAPDVAEPRRGSLAVVAAVPPPDAPARPPRVPAAPAPPPPPAPTPPAVRSTPPGPQHALPASGWATDLTVMRRLLAGLRRFV